MNRFNILFLIFVACSVANAFAYDFLYYNYEADTLYFNITSDGPLDYTAEVTYDDTMFGETSYYAGDIVIPDSVYHNGVYYHITRIGEQAFRDAQEMSSITIPKSITSIQTFPFGAFDGCPNLEFITVDADNTVYDSRIDCNAIIETASNTLIVGSNNSRIPPTVTGIGKVAFLYRTISYLDIPDNIISIDDEAFSACTQLQTVNIGAGLSSLGEQVFAECPMLTSISVSSTNTHFFIHDDALYSIDTTSLYFGLQGVPTIKIPKQVQTIIGGAFDHHSDIETIVCYPDTPPTLGNNAFADMSSTAVLNVHYDALDAYKAISAYTDAFAEIKGFSDVEGTASTSATLKWRPDTTVVEYTVNIYTADTLFARYKVDSDGNATEVTLYAPHRIRKDSTSSSTDFFVLTIKNLTIKTSYIYEITGVDRNSEQVYHEMGTFQTTDYPAGIDSTDADDPQRTTRKILLDGQIVILRGDHVFDVQGKMVK